MKQWMRILACFFLMGSLAACSSSEQGASGGGMANSRPNAVFVDDFSDPSSGWETWGEANGSYVVYQNGGLRILVMEKQFDYWSRPGKRFVDSRVEVDAIKLAGPNDNDFGLMCRYQDKNNFYAFLISSDGYAGILKVEDGNYKVISGSQLTATGQVHTGETLNHIQADCIGQSLGLEVNGQVVAQAQDGGFTAGEVGVIAGTNANPGVDIFFDNFVVSKP
jgi:hypothetical protein